MLTDFVDDGDDMMIILIEWIYADVIMVLVRMIFHQCQDKQLE